MVAVSLSAGAHDIWPALAALWRERSLCDVELMVNGISFHAHRIVLAASSSIFKALVAVSADRDTIVPLTMPSAAAFGLALEFIYMRRCEVPSTELLELLVETARRLGLRALQSVAEAAIHDAATAVRQRADEHEPDLFIAESVRPIAALSGGAATSVGVPAVEVAGVGADSHSTQTTAAFEPAENRGACVAHQASATGGESSAAIKQGKQAAAQAAADGASAEAVQAATAGAKQLAMEAAAAAAATAAAEAAAAAARADTGLGAVFTSAGQLSLAAETAGVIVADAEAHARLTSLLPIILPNPNYNPHPHPSPNPNPDPNPRPLGTTRDISGHLGTSRLSLEPTISPAVALRSEPGVSSEPGSQCNALGSSRLISGVGDSHGSQRTLLPGDPPRFTCLTATSVRVGDEYQATIPALVEQARSAPHSRAQADPALQTDPTLQTEPTFGSASSTPTPMAGADLAEPLDPRPHPRPQPHPHPRPCPCPSLTLALALALTLTSPSPTPTPTPTSSPTSSPSPTPTPAPFTLTLTGRVLARGRRGADGVLIGTG